MVTINLAYTAPVNPAGASPALTQSQVWAGLQLKVRRAQDFVPVIEACVVLSEDREPGTGNARVVREVRFANKDKDKDGKGEEKEGRRTVRETCVHYAPCRVVFEQPDGSTVINVVGRGPGGELLLSYVFEWRHPDVEEGSARARELEEGHWKVAKMAVESSIDSIRRFVQEGKIQ
ncbi:hypothetical protein F5X96DRAFT_669411 [Biscogniauxia mediterranea]|nr:hypothetical protein F5X96DRAFT_669411 [Biscogniauxia mediterranea]